MTSSHLSPTAIRWQAFASSGKRLFTAHGGLPGPPTAWRLSSDGTSPLLKGTIASRSDGGLLVRFGDGEAGTAGSARITRGPGGWFVTDGAFREGSKMALFSGRVGDDGAFSLGVHCHGVALDPIVRCFLSPTLAAGARDAVASGYFFLNGDVRSEIVTSAAFQAGVGPVVLPGLGAVNIRGRGTYAGGRLLFDRATLQADRLASPLAVRDLHLGDLPPLEEEIPVPASAAMSPCQVPRRPAS